MTRSETTHAEATRTAANEPCMSCYAPPPSEPCHYPHHRGSGGRFGGDDWNPLYWVALCRRCHNRLDGRNGVSATATYQTEAVIDQIEKRLPAWRRRWT